MYDTVAENEEYMFVSFCKQMLYFSGRAREDRYGCGNRAAIVS